MYADLLDKITGAIFKWTGNSQTGAALVEISNTTPIPVAGTVTAITSPDKETPHIAFKCIQAFTGVSLNNVVVAIVIVNTANPAVELIKWLNINTGLEVTAPTPFDNYLQYIGGNSLTLAQLQSAGLATQTTLAALLTELQLKADLTETQPVVATARVCTGTQFISGLSSVTPASLTIPANSVVAEIQADGGTVRVRRDAGAPSATQGWRIDDGMSLTVDSVLAGVRLLAQSGGTTNVQIAYFDRV